MLGSTDVKGFYVQGPVVKQKQHYIEEGLQIPLLRESEVLNRNTSVNSQICNAGRV